MPLRQLEDGRIVTEHEAIAAGLGGEVFPDDCVISLLAGFVHRELNGLAQELKAPLLVETSPTARIPCSRRGLTDGPAE